MHIKRVKPADYVKLVKHVKHIELVKLAKLVKHVKLTEERITLLLRFSFLFPILSNSNCRSLNKDDNC